MIPSTIFMLNIREILDSDIPVLAELKAENWGDIDYWIYRITGYLKLELHPQKALNPRIIYVALLDNEIVGLIAGHLTKRYNCDGELQWINVTSKHKNEGIASLMLKKLAKWFEVHDAKSVCIDVDPENIEGIHFYKKHNAEQLNTHWMVWHDISVLL